MLRPFSSYCSTDLKWLEFLPSSWRMLRAKQVFRLSVDKAPLNNELELLSVYTHIGVKPRKDLEQRGNRASTTDGYWIVRKGDIISNKLLAWMGAVGVSHYEGVTSPAYDVLRPIQPCNTDYYHYLFRTPIYLQQFKIRSRGIMDMRLRLYFDQLGQVPVPVPPIDEQESIVAFLNWKTTQINKFILNKRRLMELLVERRNILVLESLKLADTQNLRLGVVAERIERQIKCRDDELYTPIGLYNRGRGIFHKEPTKGSELGDSTFFWIDEGDLVLSGQFAWEGAIALAKQEDTGCVASHRYPILRGKQDLVESAYLLSFFRTEMGHMILNYHSRGAAGRNRPLNASLLMKEKIPVPPLSVQQEIADIVCLEQKLAGIIADQITALRGYQARLISDVVTGKMDVRGIEVPKVTVEELQVLDDEIEELSEEIVEEGVIDETN